VPPPKRRVRRATRFLERVVDFKRAFYLGALTIHRQILIGIGTNIARIKIKLSAV
jgi:hypothetical protein